MTQRTAIRLDDQTNERIRSLARQWKVSQAEVVRLAVSQVEKPDRTADSTALLLQLHHSGGGLSPDAAQAFLGEVRSNRKKWRGT